MASGAKILLVPAGSLETRPGRGIETRCALPPELAGVTPPEQPMTAPEARAWINKQLEKRANGEPAEARDDQ